MLPKDEEPMSFGEIRKKTKNHGYVKKKETAEIKCEKCEWMFRPTRKKQVLCFDCDDDSEREKRKYTKRKDIEWP